MEASREQGNATESESPGHGLDRSAAGLTVEAETPFAEGSNAQLDPDLRYRLISERAYARYCERVYSDGYDVDDWLEAEAEVDHAMVVPRGAPQ